MKLKAKISRRICITGGPGSGKTTLIDGLKNAGFNVMPEISREIIADAQNSGIDQPFLADSYSFSERLLEGRIRQFHNASINPTFFDRGIPDVVAYHHYLGEDILTAFAKASKNYRYDQIFYLPFWEEIYEQDEHRYETAIQAQNIGDQLLKTYLSYGYSPLTVPKTGVEERLEFVKEMLV